MAKSGLLECDKCEKVTKTPYGSSVGYNEVVLTLNSQSTRVLICDDCAVELGLKEPNGKGKDLPVQDLKDKLFDIVAEVAQAVLDDNQ